MDLYDKRDRAGVLEADYLPELEQGGLGILGAAIYIEDKYLPEQALRIALDQVARLYAEVEQTVRFAICRTHAEISGSGSTSSSSSIAAGRKPSGPSWIAGCHGPTSCPTFRTTARLAT